MNAQKEKSRNAEEELIASRCSQCERIPARLKSGPLTQIEALEELGVLRLASRINDLKNAGHCIHKQMIEVTNRFGEKCRVAQYRLQ